MRAKSIQGKTQAEIQNALESCMADGFLPTLALIFVSIGVDRAGICSLLHEKNIAIFGATTGGEFISGDVTSDSAAILLMDINASCFHILFNGDTQDTRVAARNLAEQAHELFSNPAYIVCGSGVEVDGELIIRGLEDRAGPDSIIFGGMAADDFKVQESLVFTNQKTSDRGIVLLVLDGDKIELKGRATCGWEPYGTEKVITNGEVWWIHTIDDLPAMDLIIKYMGLADSDKETVERVTPLDAIDFPLLLYRNDGAPIIRPILFINWDERSVKVNGSVRTGDKIRFVMPMDFKVVDQVVQECKTVQENEMFSADALIMFSCVGRLAALGPMIDKEIDGVRETYNAPMAGFFSFGEFGRATNGNHEYHNMTCCWVALKEKEK